MKEIEILQKTNKLARAIFELSHNKKDLPHDYKFYDSHNDECVLVWKSACYAQLILQRVDMKIVCEKLQESGIDITNNNF